MRQTTRTEYLLSKLKFHKFRKSGTTQYSKGLLNEEYVLHAPNDLPHAELKRCSRVEVGNNEWMLEEPADRNNI
jgi:hypothetical protein